jgi:hypothetical protein
VTYFKLVSAGKKLTTIPKADGGFHGFQINNKRDCAGDPTDKVVDFAIVHDI